MRRLLILLLLPLPLMAATDPPVKLDGGNTLQLCGNCTPREIRAAITPGTFTVKKGEKLQVVEVSLNNARDQKWISWFHAQWDVAMGKPSALLIDVSKELTQAGTYNVVLEIRPGLPRLTLQVVQPPAQLEVPAKLLIGRTQRSPFSCCDSNQASFDVRETSSLASISELTVFNLPATQGTEGVTGTLALKGTPSVPAGKVATLNVDLQGEYPRGMVAGTVKLIAPQLAQPVSLPYEVRTRLHPLYLLAAIVAGLLLSWLVRVLLRNSIERSQAKLQASDILDDVDAHVRNYDDTLRRAIQAAWDSLKEAAGKDDAAGISRQATELRNVWQEEVRKFGERDAQAGDELSGLQGVLLVNWLVPARVEEELSKARTACANAKIAISQRKPDRALEFVGTAGKNLAESLRNQGLTWEHKANGLLKQFANAALGIPEMVRVTFARAIEQSPPQLDRIKNEEIAPSPTAMQRALEDLQTQLSDLNATLASLADLLKKEWGAIEKVWRPKAAQLPHKELLQQLSVQFLELASDVGGAGKDPAPLNDGLAARLSVLQDGWKAAILGQIPSDHAEKPKIEAEIDKRDFQLAVLAVIAVVCHLQLPWGDTQFDSIAPAWSPTSPLRRNPQIITIFGVSAPPSDDSLPRVRILRVLRWAQVLQAGVVCAFAALWSFTSYKETWDGTWPGLLAPMLGAFLLDISVDGLKTQIKEQKA